MATASAPNLADFVSPGPVRSVAFCTRPDGTLLLASAGYDGTVRLWDPVTGTPAGDPLTGHTGPVWSVAFGTRPDGTLLLASDGDTIRLWDPATGTPAGDPLTGHTGRVLSVAFGTRPDGTLLLASAGVDDTIRLWDPATGTPAGDPLTGHTGRVRSVAFGTRPDGTLLLASAGEDGTVRLWDPETGEQPFVRAEPETDSPFAKDDEAVDDLLNRRLLAGHLAGTIAQLTAPEQAADDRAISAVVHIDGRWGSGKSTLVELMWSGLRVASLPRDAIDVPELRDPVIVRYDAWRESAIAPEWWSLATHVNRAIRHERSLPTRVWMTLIGIVRRVGRSPAASLATLALVVLAVTWARGWWRDADKIAGGLTLVATVITLCLATGRILFWTSPAFGRLYANADDNPLGEIAEIIARLRRYSPRVGCNQVGADIVFAGWTVCSLAWLAGSLIRNASYDLIERTWFPLLLFVLGIAFYATYMHGCLEKPKRTVIMVIDDLDRCEAPRVVRLLETVHTLLRHHLNVSRLRRWRGQAPFVALILSDGRWVRQAFETAYKDFDRGSAVFGLGADFLEKLFDHTVIVPTLSASQIASIVTSATSKSRPSRQTRTATPPTAPPRADETRAPLRSRQSSSPGSPSPSVSPSAEHELDARQRIELDTVIRETRPVAARSRRDHLLAGYSELMPANPRLIKRVANTWGMLKAVRLHLGHQENDDVLTRAAIFFVRFPKLVDQLLDEPVPPILDANDAKSPWARPDVLQVLTRPDGQRIAITSLARCYGKEYPTVPVRPPSDASA